ncbi:sugar ABC transporter ATP-binding protein [Lysinibacillus sp. NPDC096418]|uniref:sugar ABC transporter ATP-binding protein n=1 Tax=Lysinibacillus sp. NPDC096418 TaxID=3364138 RepID=UPI0038304753
MHTKRGGKVEPILKIENVSKSFPGVKALSNVHLTLHAGEVLALVGENGAGKSTLMKILSGIYKKDEGSIQYLGKEIEVLSPKHAQKLGISIIHQELNLMKDLTIAQNIFIGREPKSANLFVKDKKLNQDTKELFERLGIQLDPKMKVQHLSVAKQQMVEIAKALSLDAKIIVMDEPTTALTDAEIDALFNIIEDLKRKGVGIIYISHRMDELKRISDRVMIMRDGCYIDTLEMKGIDMNHVIKLMVGREVYIESKPQTDSNTEEKILEVRNISTKSHLKNVSFELHKGEILGFSGLMGAGRTEIARVIFGADKCSEGEIYMHGKKVKIKSPSDAVKLGIGYLSEDRKQYGLLVNMDVKSNMVLPTIRNFQSKLGFINNHKIKSISKDFVKRLNIKTPSIDQEIRLLSGGNQQKVVIAKWLYRNCDILIFDEPTRGIDVGAKGEIYKLLDELASEGKAIIMISSELPEILRMSHRIMVMAEGEIRAVINAEEATQELIMSYATNLT